MLEIEDIIINREGADLAMVKVKENIDIERFTPICLPQKGQIYRRDCRSINQYLFFEYNNANAPLTGPDFKYFLNTTQKKMGYVAGWGRNEKGSGPGNQLEVEVKCPKWLIQKSGCRSFWYGLKNVLV